LGMRVTSSGVGLDAYRAALDHINVTWGPPAEPTLVRPLVRPTGTPAKKRRLEAPLPQPEPTTAPPETGSKTPSSMLDVLLGALARVSGSPAAKAILEQHLKHVMQNPALICPATAVKVTATVQDLRYVETGEVHLIEALLADARISCAITCLETHVDHLGVRLQVIPPPEEPKRPVARALLTAGPARPA
jgi:hypothetical protein